MEYTLPLSTWFWLFVPMTAIIVITFISMLVEGR